MHVWCILFDGLLQDPSGNSVLLSPRGTGHHLCVVTAFAGLPFLSMTGGLFKRGKVLPMVKPFWKLLLHPAFKLVFRIWSISLILKSLFLNIKEHLGMSIEWNVLGDISPYLQKLLQIFFASLWMCWGLRGKCWNQLRYLKTDNQWRKLERLRMGLSGKELLERRCLARKEVMERCFTRFWVALCSEMCSDSSLCPHRERLGSLAGLGIRLEMPWKG